MVADVADSAGDSGRCAAGRHLGALLSLAVRSLQSAPAGPGPRLARVRRVHGGADPAAVPARPGTGQTDSATVWRVLFPVGFGIYVEDFGMRLALLFLIAY